MTTVLLKSDLRALYSALGRLLPPASIPTSAEEIVEINRLRDVLGTVIHEMLPVQHRGTKVLEWRIPTARAPTMNSYAFMKGWLKGKVMRDLTDNLRALLETNPIAKLNGAKRKRWVRVTRFTPSRGKVDEVSVDAIGGKMPLDALVHLDVLADDARKFVHREALVATTSRGNTHVLVEVFEMGDEGSHVDDVPNDARVEQVVKKRGPFVRALARPVAMEVPLQRARRQRAK